MFLVMEKPVFVVLRKYFSRVNGVHSPFTTSSLDIIVFESFEEAKASVMSWAESMGLEQHVLCDYGELSREAAQTDDLVFSVSVSRCVSRYFVNVGANIFQKYVL